MTETGLHVLYLYTYEIMLQSTIIVIPNGFKTVTFYRDYFSCGKCTNLQLRII